MRVNVTLIHKLLVNPEEVNESGWEVAKYEYTKVAMGVFEKENEIDICEKAYMQSQHISQSWPLNEEWLHTYVERNRSTMAGDRVKIHMIDSEDVVYEVSDFGFTRVVA